MVSAETETEIEEYLGRVPSWITALPEPSAEHSWAIARDLQFGETELTPREKALVGLSAAAAIQCEYCTHFHTEEAKLEDVMDEELAEAIGVAGAVRYFSTVLHGRKIDYDEFVSETAHIVDHVKEQQAAAPSDD